MTCPRALDIVWSKGRGVNGVRTSEPPAVVGELGIGLRCPGRDLAVPDRVDASLSRHRQATRARIRRPGGGGAIRSLAPLPVAGKPDQEADPGRAPWRGWSCR